MDLAKICLKITRNELNGNGAVLDADLSVVNYGAKDGEIPRFKTKKNPSLSQRVSNMAGAERLELATPGFGDRCSTN
jgi:hypothetical protein